MSDPGFIGNVRPSVPAGTLSNPIAPDTQTPTSVSARMLDIVRDTNGAGMMGYNAFLLYPPGSVGRALYALLSIVTSLPSELALFGFSSQPTFRNLAINGDMRLNQAVQIPTTTDGAYPVDMWRFDNMATARLTAQQETTALFPGFERCLLATVTNAGAPAIGDVHGFTTSVEGTDIGFLRFGAATAGALAITVQVRCSVPGTYALAVRNAAADRSYVTPLVVNAANTVETKTFLIPGDVAGTWVNGAAAALSVSIGLAVGTTFQTPNASVWQAGNFRGLTGQAQLTATNGATFRCTGYQSEPTDVANPTFTPFERLPLDISQRRAMRYWESTYERGVAPGSSTSRGIIRMPAFDANTLIPLNNLWKIEKMAAPLVSAWSPTTGLINKARSVSTGADITLTTYTSPDQWGMNLISSAGAFNGGQYYEMHLAANSRI